MHLLSGVQAQEHPFAVRISSPSSDWKPSKAYNPQRPVEATTITSYVTRWCIHEHDGDLPPDIVIPP